MMKDLKKISTYFMFVFGFYHIIDQLAMANSLRWYGHVFRREDCHVLRNALDFQVEGQR